MEVRLICNISESWLKIIPCFRGLSVKSTRSSFCFENVSSKCLCWWFNLSRYFTKEMVPHLRCKCHIGKFARPYDSYYMSHAAWLMPYYISHVTWIICYFITDHLFRRRFNRFLTNQILILQQILKRHKCTRKIVASMKRKLCKLSKKGWFQTLFLYFIS